MSTGATCEAVVLVVEDSALVRLILIDFLESAGFAVIEAIDAAAALQVLETGADFHVVFTDIQGPGPIDGMELAHCVCEQRPGVPVVVTSGRTDPGPLPPGGRFVPKPYDNHKVVTLLRELVAA